MGTLLYIAPEIIRGDRYDERCDVYSFSIVLLAMLQLKDDVLTLFAEEVSKKYTHIDYWGGGDTTIPSPGRSPKQPLPGIGLHDPLHGRQACPELNSFYQRIGKICPR